MGDDIRKARDIARLFSPNDESLARLRSLMAGESPLEVLDEHLIDDGAHWTPEGPQGQLWVIRWYWDMGIVEAQGYPHGSGEFSGHAADLPEARREALRIAGLIADGKTRED